MQIHAENDLSKEFTPMKPKSYDLIEVLNQSPYVLIVELVSGYADKISGSKYRYEFNVIQSLKGKGELRVLHTNIALHLGRKYLIFSAPKHIANYGKSSTIEVHNVEDNAYLIDGHLMKEILEVDPFLDMDKEEIWLRLRFGIYVVDKSIEVRNVVLKSFNKNEEEILDSYTLAPWGNIIKELDNKSTTQVK